jgi:hypothetical protein
MRAWHFLIPRKRLVCLHDLFQYRENVPHGCHEGLKGENPLTPLKFYSVNTENHPIIQSRPHPVSAGRHPIIFPLALNISCILEKGKFMIFSLLTWASQNRDILDCLKMPCLVLACPS